MNGWIKLHRKMLAWEWYGDVPTTMLFLHCILRANWKDCSWRGRTIRRGSFFTSIASLSSETGLTIKQVRGALERLERTGELASERANEGTMITVSNFETYNDCEEAEGTPEGTPEGKQTAHQGADEGHARGQQIKKYKKGKKERSEEGVRARAARPSSRDEFDDFFREIGLYPRDAEATWHKWEGNGWTNGKSPIKCWRSTIRNWKAQRFFPTQKSPSDYEPGWPSTESTEPEEKPEVDLWATLKANKAKEDAMLEELAGTPVPAGEFDPTF